MALLSCLVKPQVLWTLAVASPRELVHALRVSLTLPTLLLFFFFNFLEEFSRKSGREGKERETSR